MRDKKRERPLNVNKGGGGALFLPFFFDIFLTHYEFYTASPKVYTAIMSEDEQFQRRSKDPNALRQ